MKREQLDLTVSSRRHPRAHVELDMELADIEREARRAPALCVELSEGGMRLVTACAATRGDKVELRLFTGDRPLALLGRVVWSTDLDQGERVVGLAFEHGASPDALKHYVSTQVAKQSWDRSPRMF